MNFQSICAAIETPLNTAFASLSPPVGVYFDNILPVSPDPPSEYARVSIDFGVLAESTLDCPLDRARGSLIVRIYTPKDVGGLRIRQLASVCKAAFDAINSSKKSTTGIFLRVQDVSGPMFYQNQSEPHFMARIEASWHATNTG